MRTVASLMTLLQGVTTCSVGSAGPAASAAVTVHEAAAAARHHLLLSDEEERIITAHLQLGEVTGRAGSGHYGSVLLATSYYTKTGTHVEKSIHLRARLGLHVTSTKLRTGGTPSPERAQSPGDSDAVVTVCACSA